MREPTTDLVESMFVDRWSPRSFASDPIPDEHIEAIFEAARWAPSWGNSQPWFFLWETDGRDRPAFESILIERNRNWAHRAPLVGLVLASPLDQQGEPLPTYRFDTGAATFAMMLQAHVLGYSTHIMGGIDRELAHELTGTDADSYAVIAGFVIGKRGEPSVLHPRLQERERPNSRKGLDQVAARGIRAAANPAINPPGP